MAKKVGRPKLRSDSFRGVEVARALSNPIRVEILMAMNAPPQRMSPVGFAKKSGVPLGNSAYHFRELLSAGCIELADSQPRRGAMEHFYEPVQTALACQHEWEQLGPAIRQSLAASVLRGGVEALGRAIDDRTFEARPESHLSWNTMRVDQEGWESAGSVMDRALAELMEIEAESIERSGEKVFLGSFLMSLFESPEPE